MFTGIVEEVGTVRQMPAAGRAGKLGISARTVLEGTAIGDSIAVNGVCLTVVSMGASSFFVDVMPETLSRSSLGALHVGSPVNLERAMPANGRFGGHIVSGHIDGVGTIESIRADQNAQRVRIACPPEIALLIVEKGSITIDGISLTVTQVDGRGFEVSLIPHTFANTALSSKRPGDTVNLENDIVGKYVQKLLSAPAIDTSPPQQGITMEFLAKNGF